MQSITIKQKQRLFAYKECKKILIQYKASNTTNVERSNIPTGGINLRAGRIKGSVIERKMGVSGLLCPCI